VADRLRSIQRTERFDPVFWSARRGQFRSSDQTKDGHHHGGGHDDDIQQENAAHVAPLDHATDGWAGRDAAERRRGKQL
jgi:hypothetical protein